MVRIGLRSVWFTFYYVWFIVFGGSHKKGVIGAGPGNFLLSRKKEMDGMGMGVNERISFSIEDFFCLGLLVGDLTWELWH